MNVRHVCKWCVVAALAALGTSFGLHKAIAAQPGPADAEQGVQVLTRGPVHEAFAETVTFDPEPGIVVPKAPPAAIEEVPPDQRPEGANVAWIPGYWGWDDERKRFPLGQRHLARPAAGPPMGARLLGQVRARLSMDFRVLGRRQGDRGAILARAACDGRSRSQHRRAFGRRTPGCPAVGCGSRAATPGGPVSGRPCSRIGIGFLPITFGPRAATSSSTATGITRSAVAACCLRRSISMRACMRGPGFSYSPSTVIDLGVFANHLFLRPQYQHYYFGDYYAANYQAAGFYPSYSYNSGRYGYDPIYAHERWQHRQDGQWEHRVAADFQNRRDHEDARPPRTWAAQRALGAGGVAVQRGGTPWWPRHSPNSQRARTVRCDSSRWTR